MTEPFDFPACGRVAFGIGRVRRIGADVKSLTNATKAILITDPGIVGTGLAHEVLEYLQAEGVDPRLFDDVRSDPTAASIDRAADAVRASGAGCVIGMGGGSAMDVAKTAALVASGDALTERYKCLSRPFPEKRYRTIMIPTTSGTGAEATRTVVFSDCDDRKVWGWAPDMVADLVLLDPRLTARLPVHLTAATGLDALVHAIEACVSRNANPFTQAMGLRAVRLVAENLERAMSHPGDLEARGNLAIASTLAGMGINGSGTCLAHCLGHALGSLAHIHHGRAVALALNVIYPWNAVAAVSIHAEIARALGVPDGGMGEAELALAGADAYARLLKSVCLPTSLKGDGLSDADQKRLLEMVLAPENLPMRTCNPREASEADLRHFVMELLK